MSETTIPAPVFEEFTEENLSTVLNITSVPKELIDKINKLSQDDELSQTFKDNFIDYTTVLTKGAFSPEQYVNAVQYVSYRLMGHNVRQAWMKTFPERERALQAKGNSSKDINSHASMYNKTKLVNMITEQTLVPSYVINNSYFQEALDTQVKLMRDSEVSPKVRSDAAKAVLEYTVMPDALLANKDEVATKSLDIIEQLSKSVNALAQAKQSSIIEGTVTTKEVAQMSIYQDKVEDGELVDE